MRGFSLVDHLIKHRFHINILLIINIITRHSCLLDNKSVNNLDIEEEQAVVGGEDDEVPLQDYVGVEG